MEEVDPWPSNVARGFSYAGWTDDGYATEESDQSLRDLAATGATHVAIVVTEYMETKSSDTVGPYLERTPTVDSVRGALELASSLGLRTIIKPHVDLLDGTYRGMIEPSDPDAWFRSYRDFILPWADVAAEQGCEAFWVGTELESMMVYSGHWQQIIDEVRDRFPGTVVYAANWSDIEGEATLRVATMVDALGVDAYFPVADWPDPTVADMLASWQHWLTVIDWLTQRTGKPIIITEIGCASRRGAPMSPWDYESDEPVDLNVQARYYEAALRVLPTSPDIKGVFFWGWGVAEGGPGDGDHTPRGKPAEDQIRRFWSI